MNNKEDYQICTDEEKGYIILKTGDSLNYDKFKGKLLENQYIHTNYVSIRGEFATRGAIIDVFDKAAKEPIRIVLDDEKIISIKIFNPVTQRTIKEVNSYQLTSVKDNIVIPSDNNNVLEETSVLTDFLALEEGDYVVHLNYGIGKFWGFKKSKVQNRECEFVAIEYKGGILMYVPVTHLYLVFRYETNTEIELTDVHRNMWKNIQINMTKGINTFAINLMANQIKRKEKTGIVYAKIEELENEFNKSFKFSETDDQLKTISFFDDQLSNGNVIDGIICGDSGFGKTEIAARIAFRIVSNGKQVAVLCPTTLLVEQHYMTFKERFKDFPITIEKVSRYNTPSQIKSIIQKVVDGKVDIIIGTTSLVKNKFTFKDLGLLIVDEEHKFGVEDKEKLRFINDKVNVIALSATPIPRTLYMSLQKLKDISYVKTPPKQMAGVETKVIEFDKTLLKQIIEEELNRDGQIFFVTDKIKNLPLLTRFLNEYFKNVATGIAHGQLPNKELEDIFLKFYFGEYKVLLSTNIVESGIDITTANTIIVHNAQNFGLADLHQLRGRVGRRDRKGYAYLVIPAEKAVEPSSYRRLKILEEYSFLGSGFSISMFDMKARGTGNVLGKEQHGFMKKLGIELYSHLLELTLRKLEGKKLFEPSIEIPFYFHISSELLPNDKMRFYYYKRFSDVKNMEELELLKEELMDFCGHINKETEEFIFYHRLRIICKERNIYKILRDENELIVKIFNKKDIILPYKNFAVPSILFRYIQKNL